jgi:hypothetical protein
VTIIILLQGTNNNFYLPVHCSDDRWTYEDQSWARIADLLPVVVESAESGDEVANKILHNSVGELASSVKAVVQRLDLGGEGDTRILSDFPPLKYMFFSRSRRRTTR